ncbi:hypothetical protein FE392_04380 [Xenorhabdus sp. 12]|uniref:N-acetyltransferase domain-containing protein n=1 Tax=Xenorhabdus santafensis TaxID=2582833 RepID=A0ABU4S5T0_9GAMM|nr:hypothetical protein [Xenorhabdus sp. 12]MDX7986572.1 hypothetical protein [Xenorhabdus sp. 12]
MKDIPPLKNISLFSRVKSLLSIKPSAKEIYQREYATKIIEVNKDQMLRHLYRINQDSSNWHKGLGVIDSNSEYAIRQQSFEAVYKGIEREHQHSLLSTLPSTSGHRYFVCTIQNNMPVGIMVFLPGTSEYSYGKPDYIDYLLTHPGIKSIGSLLVEKAVESLTNDELRVNAKHSSTPFYTELGFTRSGGSNNNTVSMVLVPKESEKWEMVNNVYRLKKYI